MRNIHKNLKKNLLIKIISLNFFWIKYFKYFRCFQSIKTEKKSIYLAQKFKTKALFSLGSANSQTSKLLYLVKCEHVFE